MLGAQFVVFPADKKISDDAKVWIDLLTSKICLHPTCLQTFIRRCLARDPRERPDIMELASDPFLRPK